MAWNDYPLTDEEWAEIEQGLAARAAKPEQSLPEAVPAWAVWGQRLGWVLLPVTLRVMATRGQSEGQRLSTELLQSLTALLLSLPHLALRYGSQPRR